MNGRPFLSLAIAAAVIAATVAAASVSGATRESARGAEHIPVRLL